MKYLILLFSLSAYSVELKPFVTDYCTYFFNGTLKSPKLWADCCHAHDLDYWVGGSSEDQLYSDQRLKSCIDSKGVKWMGALMYQGVRLGHHSPVKSKYHWSWGWQVKRKKVVLSSQEKKSILKKLKSVNAPDKLKAEFIKNRLR